MSFTKDEDILYVATKMFKLHFVEKKTCSLIHHNFFVKKVSIYVVK